MDKLLIATRNRGKLAEYRQLLADLPLTVTTLDDEGLDIEVEETGATFAENASLKARTCADLSGLWTWADDSGIEVDALDGHPGVYSARYGGPDATDRDRYLRLLDELRAAPPQRWTAHFRCVVAIALPDGASYTAEGTVEGVITDQPRGEHGFGYDPVFYLPDYGATMAELPPQIKNRIGHRALASANARQILHELLAQNGP